MADWKQQYLAGLQAREAIEQADKELISRYTKLADKKAELYAELRQLRKSTTTTANTVNEPAVAPPAPLVAYGWGRQTSPPPVPESATLARLRLDFVQAQQDRAQQQSQLDSTQRELDALRAKAKADQRQLALLNAGHAQLTTKLRDREEELRGKAKLLVDVQDENVTLNLQLNVAEDKAKKLRKENQDLIDRWMARKGQEADEMNAAGKFR